MSLTFDFPQWQLCVAGGQRKEDSEIRPNENPGTLQGTDCADWAADLADLDGDDGESGDVAGGDNVADRQPAGDVSQPRQQHLQMPPGAAGVSLTDILSDHDNQYTSGSALIDGNGTPSGAASASGSSPRGTATAYAALLRPAAGLGALAPAVAVSGDAIPGEMLLLVLSGLRDVGDCVRAALVCKHWLAVVMLSNELWYELDGIYLADGMWHRPPHAGRPLLRPPPGCDHPCSRMLTHKTTCAITLVAVRFMALRKGFEYIVESAASLWLAAQRAAAKSSGQQQQHQSRPTPSPVKGATGKDGQRQQDRAVHFGEGGPACGIGTGDTKCLRSDAATTGPSGTGAGQGAHDDDVSTGNVSGDGGGGVSANGSSSGGQRRRRITHVDQLWESCGRSRTALQVDERFNAVRVQQMVGKLCSASGAQWLPLYEGVAAVMASRADQLRDQLAEAARQAAAAVAAVEAEEDSGTAADGACTSAVLSAAAAKRQRVCTPGGATSGVGSARSPQQQRGFRGEVVYGSGSYAALFAELLRRGDTRGALALGASQRAAVAAAAEPVAAAALTSRDGGSGDGAVVQGELDEPEMREVLVVDELDEQMRTGASAGAAGRGGLPVPPPAMVAEGLMLWRQLLSAWALYRRWLEVWVVWCGPLGARVEAERQLAGAAAAHGEAPLAPPHLTNKGLLLFRSQVLLAYPLRRPLQAAALWLSARAEAANADEDDAAGGVRGRGYGCGGAGNGGYGGRDGRGGGPGLSDEHARLLREIRKLLTELAVPDDATQPPHTQTRQKLQRCFGSLLLRPVPGGTRALQLAQRLQGLRGAVAAGGFAGC